MTAWILLLALGFSQQPPTPQPFPRPGAPSTRPVTPPPPPAPTSAVEAQPAPPPLPAGPSEAELGVPVYPGAQFLGSYDAGQNQRFYIFGTTAGYIELVNYYRTILKTRGEVLFETPATHQFETGRFREQTMAFPPSVTIKDYESQQSKGYPNPRPGAQPERFPTIIQIVPAPSATPR
jgi:hypothetical protein